MELSLTNTSQGTSFFQLDEAIEILCCSTPSPLFIAILLQLSKLTRRYVWDFLIDPVKCQQVWYDVFCKELWEHREARPTTPCTYFSLHPTFVIITEGNLSGERYHISKVLVPSKLLELTSTMNVLIGGFYAHFPDATLSHPGWDNSSHVSTITAFEWYFVACAFALRIDRMIMANALTRWQETPIVPQDTTLFIAYK